MSQEKTPTGEGFEQKLNRLRMRIDLLPPEQRPHLVELADAYLRGAPAFARTGTVEP